MKTVTQQWIRNASDRKAVEAGCYFDVLDAAYVVWWIERYCRLYEGDQAGQPLELRGCHECELKRQEFEDWHVEQRGKVKRLSPAQAAGVKRAERFAACVAAGHRIDWQYDVTMRLFGWKRPDGKRRFRKASIYVAKKNKKSPTLAAWGLYLLCGDGEQGQKVFSAARDGVQARISHTHAMEMVRRSSELAAECTINKSTARITHQESRSFYDIIAGDNINSQEGLNGSVLVDETHVVDARLMKVVEYAGISRAEPFHIEVSTAGNNPDGYGKQQFDRALRVESGAEDDQSRLVAIYAAPQDLTDAALDADPLKYGRMANPAMGHTIDPAEFLESYQNAKRSISALADFKMYRLNIWQRSSNPWLKSSDWAQCGREFSEESLAEQSCIAALDLARVNDFTSLTRMFECEDADTIVIERKEPDGSIARVQFRPVRMLWNLWMTEAYAKANAHLAPLPEWAKAGYIRLTPGSVMDYGFVKSDIRKLHAVTPIREIVFDELYAEEITQQLAHGMSDSSGKVIEEGIGCERIAFKQNIMTFANPTDEFEAAVVAGALWHNNNPVISWMAGHCEVYRDANGNKRPIKPDGKKEGVKKIDGIVTGIMAYSRRAAPVAQDDGRVFFV